MFKALTADKDAYLTDQVVNGTRAETANTGDAGSLNLFKLYGATVTSGSANIELSRLLIHFDLDPIRELVTQGKVDVGNPSFEARIRLFDVYGGQTTPSRFTITVHPLSRSFDEGLGRDVVLYSDRDTCNFLTGSLLQGPWLASGANQGGLASTPVDYITAVVVGGTTASLESTQFFSEGTEDLSINVTTAISATLAGLIPDNGFRIALTSSHETDTRSYFVKRFASRTAYSPHHRPRLELRFDDSEQDDTQNLFLDEPNVVFLRNFSAGSAKNLVSASNSVTGSNSLVLRLQTPISGGTYSLSFSAGQHFRGIHAVSGTYSASVVVPLNNVHVQAKLTASGSLQMVPVWGSLDGTLGFHTGSALTFRPPQRGGRVFEPRDLLVHVQGLDADLDRELPCLVRVNLFDRLAPSRVVTRRPIDPGGDVVRDVHYRVRDVAADSILVPFDVAKNSTRLSSDSRGMFFSLDTTTLVAGRSYVIDIMIRTNGAQKIVSNASPVFRVNEPSQ